MLITSQAPSGKQKYTAPASAQLASSDIAPHTIERFISCQHKRIAGARDLSAEDAQRIIVSPFVSRLGLLGLRS